MHKHYNDVIMGAMASEIISLTIVCSTVYSGADHRKHQSSASLAFVCGEFPGDRRIPRTNGPKCGKCFHLMTSSWKHRYAAAESAAVALVTRATEMGITELISLSPDKQWSDLVSHIVKKKEARCKLRLNKGLAKPTVLCNCSDQ